MKIEKKGQLLMQGFHVYFSQTAFFIIFNQGKSTNCFRCSMLYKARSSALSHPNYQKVVEDQHWIVCLAVYYHNIPPSKKNKHMYSNNPAKQKIVSPLFMH